MTEQLPDDLRRLLDEARAKVSDTSRIWAYSSRTYESQLFDRKGLVLGGTISPFFLMNREPDEKVTIPPWNGVAAGTVLSRARLLFLASAQHDSGVETLKEWVPLLETLAKANEGLLVVTNDFQNHTILDTLLVNNYKCVMDCAVVKQGGISDDKLEKLYPKVSQRKEGLFRGSVKGTTQKISELAREALPLFETVWVRRDATVAIPAEGNHEWDDLLSEVALITVGGESYDDFKQRFEIIAQEISVSFCK
jgi:hypothetical protein